MFEIGTGEGGSATMWKQFFGPQARVVTIDVRDCSEFAESQILVRTGSQSDPTFLRGLLEEFGSPDIVLDDGSHHMADVNASFEVLYPKLSERGVYFVEDLNTAYWPNMGGGAGHPASFIERCKGIVDEIHARHSPGTVESTVDSNLTVSVCFYDMVVVLEKTPYINRDLVQNPLPQQPRKV